MKKPDFQEFSVDLIFILILDSIIYINTKYKIQPYLYEFWDRYLTICFIVVTA